MKKKIILVIGIILFFIPFVFNTYSLFRLIALAIGIFFISLSNVYNKKRSILLLAITPLILIVVSYGLDYLLFSKLNRIPIYVYEMKSSEKVSTYNSFFYRIYDCNNSLILDYNYEMSYACGENDLEVINVNTVLADPYESFKKYDNKFIKASGKISFLSGIDTIELASYEITEETLNGLVKFTDASAIKVETDSDLSKFRIYDEIEVIGLVSDITVDGEKTIITLIDTVLLPNKIYDEYSFEVISNDTKEIKEFIKDKKYYLYGLDNIYVNYGNDIIYELSYTITDSRITLDELIKDIEKEEVKNKEEVVIANIYKLEKFKIFECLENGKIYFSNSKLKFNEELCK